MGNKAYSLNDRVKRSDKTGPLGTVKQVRTEVTASPQEAKDNKGKMYYVLWDNGTLSCMGADGLELVQG